MRLRNRLKEHRAALGVNQQELGRLAGVSRQTISLIPDSGPHLRCDGRGHFHSGGGVTHESQQ